MSKKQTRRSVSLNRTLYERLKQHCEAQQLPMAALVERLLAAELGVVLPPLAERLAQRKQQAIEARWPGYEASTRDVLELETQRKREVLAAARMTPDEVRRALAPLQLAPPKPESLGVHAQAAKERRLAAIVPTVTAVSPPLPRLRGERVYSPVFCAVCTADVLGTVPLEPLGKGGALVAVCRNCASTTAPGNDKRRPQAGYTLRWQQRQKAG